MNKALVFQLNSGWLLTDGNVSDSPEFHTNGIPRENAVNADLPCMTHMYIKDHVGISWYEKEFELPALPDENSLALLCFEQAIFRTEVSVNGRLAGVHEGVEDPFYFDVTELLIPGKNRITVRTRLRF